MASEPVLVVEDTPVNLKLIRILLSRYGFDVHTAGSAEEALEALREWRPSLVLTDIQLPGMDGLELTRRLKSAPDTRDLPVVALTAYAMKADEEQAMAAGCDGYITKPIDTRAFPFQIRKYLHQNGDADDAATAERSEDRGGWDESLDEIRRTFLAEGVEHSAQLLDSIQTGFEHTQALVTLHRWAGAAGSIGYPEISRQARELEAVLAQNGPGPAARANELAAGLSGLFKASLERERLANMAPVQPVYGTMTSSAPAAPDKLAADTSPELLAALAGKRFALAGFAPDEAARLSQALDGFQAFTRELGADLREADATAQFDALVFQASAQTHAIPECNKPVLVVGPREALIRLKLPHNQPHDFLFSPWTTDDVVLRAYFAISRAESGNPAVPAPDRAGKPRIVVADDDSTIRAVVEATLRNSGFECRATSEGSSALEAIRTWQPDLAVLDVNMPGQNGFEVLAALRNDPLTKDVRVVLLTARQQETDVIRGFGLGADDYVIKPFSPMELVARLKRLLGKRA